MHASTFWGLDGRPIVLSIPSIPLFLSLGRVVPAPHTRHLLGLFAAIAQNSLLRSFSIVDFLASRQHSCRGSEELAIRKTARFKQLRTTPSYSECGAPKNSELLRAAPRYSELLRATPTKLLQAEQSSNRLRRPPATPSCSESGASKNSELLRARATPSTPSSILELQARKGLPKKGDADSHRRLELLLRACRLQNCKLF